jgi:site-specific recombinase XerD
MITIEKARCTFGSAFEAWLLAQRARNLTQHYLDLLGRTRDLWLQRWSDGEIETITADQVRTFLIWLSGKEDGPVPARLGNGGQPLSSATVSIHYRGLKALFRWLEDEELILKSPMRKVKAPRREEKLPEALTEGEVQELLERVKGSGDRNAWRDYCIHYFFCDTAVRLSELSGLDIDHLNFEEGYARVFGKGRKERLVPLGVELRRDLKKYLLKFREATKDQPALFTNEYGQRFEPGGIRTMVVRDLQCYVARKLTKCGPHTERHTAITLKLRKTRDLKTTSLIAGHSTTRTTERYIHLTGADVLRDASGSAMDDLMRGARR